MSRQNTLKSRFQHIKHKIKSEYVHIFKENHCKYFTLYFCSYLVILNPFKSFNLKELNIQSISMNSECQKQACKSVCDDDDIRWTCVWRVHVQSRIKLEHLPQNNIILYSAGLILHTDAGLYRSKLQRCLPQ